MNCKKCGRKIEEDSEFCRFCGSPVERTAREKLPKKADLSFENEDEEDEENFILALVKGINPLHIGIFVIALCLLVSIITFAVLKPRSNKEKTAEVLGEAEKPTAQVVVWDEEEINSTTVDEASEETTADAEEAVTDEAFYDASYSEKEGINRYEFIVNDLKWTEAYQDCINRGGYLVHINSDEEMSYICEQIKKEGFDDVYFYIGASRNEDSENYYWVNSEAKHFGKALNNDPVHKENWLYGEPSYQDTDFGT